MAIHHQHSHGRVFEGLEARMEKRDDNKMRFIHNKPAAQKDAINVIGDDGKKHVVHNNGGLVHVHDAKKDPIHVVGDDGKKHKVHVNGGLVHVHDFGAAQKNEVEIADDNGRKHNIQNRPDLGLVHDFGVAQKDNIDVLRNGKPHRIINHGGLVHVHDLDLAQKQAEVETVYSQVYVTESKTFAGPAQFVTVTGDTTPTPKTHASLNSAEAAYQSAKSAANAPDVTDASSSPATTTSTSYQTTPPQFTPSGASQLKGTPHTTGHTNPSVIGGTPLSQSSTNSADLTSSKSHGMTAGASAGVAFGVILGLALVGGLFFFCWRRRKQQKGREGAEKLDEKHVSTNSFFSGTAAAVGAPAGDLRRSIQSDKNLHAHTAATAPRLSLRPVTQFLPNILGGGNSNAESARGGPQMSEKPKSGWDRTPAGASQNPFDDAAVLNEKNARPVSPLNPFDEGDGSAVAAVKKSPSHSSKDSWEGSEPPTPKSTKFGTAAAVPIAAAGAAGAPKGSPAGPNNVHRVQLDFKPSMDDELELKSGQLVRMLHEYDDGWVS
jgi:hypothetical protein